MNYIHLNNKDLLKTILEKASVYARMNPDDKALLIKLL